MSGLIKSFSGRLRAGFSPSYSSVFFYLRNSGSYYFLRPDGTSRYIKP